MRRFTKLILGIDCVLVLALSLSALCWGLLETLQVETTLRPLRAACLQALQVPTTRLAVQGTALGLLLIHLFWMEWTLRARRRSNAIVVTREDGTLIIAVSAVEDSLERALKQQAGVRDVRVRMRTAEAPQDPADVVCVASILDGEGIHSVEERMRQAVKRRFQEILPQQTVRVSVRLRRFVAGEAPRPRRAGGEVERVYRGPEYPVEGF